ncbi:EI24 domain-containing protein [Agromyces sp. MMS24-JH15]|uniref:EI24 domain-containing protein n=1 Tax=Agromyces sp. MMS24-JH15 TaxID=3243765 RepID=UPI0037484046
MIVGFLEGADLLGRGFGTWRRHPGLMLLGLVPAALVFSLIVVALVTFGFGLPRLAHWATPFADDWTPLWRGILRWGLVVVSFAAAVVVAMMTFTALTLAVGDPFYERIWRAVELDLGGEVPERGAGFWRGVADAGELLALGIAAALAVWLVGFIPLVGGVLAPVAGAFLSGRILARELAGRAFEARGMRLRERRATLRLAPARVLGFGVATQLCFLVPFGAILAMPAAVAGATLLARGLLDQATASPPSPSATGSPPTVSTVQPEASASTSEDERFSSRG